MIKSILIIIKNIIRAFIRLFANILVRIVCYLIFIFSGEWGKWNKVTIRKIRRVRLFTKYKIKIWKKAPNVMKFLGWGPYLEELNKKFGDGM